MSFRRFVVRTIAVLAVVTCAGVFAAMARDWSGVYTYNEESFEPDGSRISYWFRLEVTDTAGKLTAILSNGTNGKTTRRVQLTADAGPTRAQFYYDRCLPLTKKQTEPCSAEEFNQGEQLFALEEIPVHCRTELVTRWQKLNLAQQTETGDSSSRSVFFKKSL